MLTRWGNSQLRNKKGTIKSEIVNRRWPGQTIQLPPGKGQKDKQRSTKHAHKAKTRGTRTPLKSREK